MGVYQSIYMGPYIQAPSQTKFIDIEVRRCEKKVSHHVKDGDKFCSICGSPVIIKPESKPINWSAWSALNEKFDDSLTPRGDDSILVPNQLLKGAYNTHIDSERNGIYNLPSDEIKVRDIELMKEQYKKGIEFLQSEGFEVTFHYGLIIDFS